MVQLLGKQKKIWSQLMNNLSKCFLLAFYGLVPAWAYADEVCLSELSHQVDTKLENGEPISVLSIKYHSSKLALTVPFSAENSSCKKINNKGLIKITVPADRPRLKTIYYFKSGDEFRYIGNASITTSSGEERVSGVGEINKGDSLSNISLEGVASEDVAVISRIINLPFNVASDNVPDLYRDMRYIEIDALSESTGNKICDSTESVFYYCKTKSGKNLNLCYSPFSGDITYNYGRQGRELSINDFSLMGDIFSFKNKNTTYNVSPSKGEISVIQNGKQLSVISCT
jgi:hypothetical protein